MKCPDPSWEDDCLGSHKFDKEGFCIFCGNKEEAMTHEEKKLVAIMLLKENAEFLKKWLDHQAKFANEVSPWEQLFLSIIKNVEAL